MLVDCGSSGSRAYIYYWPAGEQMDTNRLIGSIKKVKQADGKIASLQVKPGLTSVRGNPEAASEYTRPFMDFARTHIPAAHRSSSRILFLATAGLRLLSDDLQHRIINDIETDLREDYSDFNDIQARVISGYEEGVYQWFSANGAANRLTKPSTYRSIGGRGAKFAVLEMGGASIQVTFEMTPQIKAMVETRLSQLSMPEARYLLQQSRKYVKIGPQNGAELFSVSFLGFGSKSARDLSTDLLLRDFAQSSPSIDLYLKPNSTILLEDPCLAPGAVQLVQKPIAILKQTGRKIGKAVSDGEAKINVRFIGVLGDYNQCQRLLVRAIVIAKQERYQCPDKSPLVEPCSVSLLATDFVPFTRMQTLALGEFYYTSNSFYDTTGQYVTPVALVKILRLCSTPYEQLLKQYPKEVEQEAERVLLGCFKLNWVFVWLHFALRMPLNYLAADLTQIQRLNNIDIEWTRGAILLTAMNS